MYPVTSPRVIKLEAIVHLEPAVCACAYADRAWMAWPPEPMQLHLPSVPQSSFEKGLLVAGHLKEGVCGQVLRTLVESEINT